MKQLSALFLVLLLILSPSCKFFKGGKFGRKGDPMASWQARQDSIRVADSIRKIQDQLLSLENAKLDSIRRSEENLSAWESRYRYNIVVGSFITPEYARGLAEEYKTQGYDAKILKMKGSRFELVSAEAHENFRKAVARLKEFQDTVSIDAWMYINK
jgi:hypothetical protein